jgi:hypothetical protein
MDGGGSGAASVWLASAGSDDLRSLFIYLRFDASVEDPGQLLTAAEWAALERLHRLDRALWRLLDGMPHPVRAPVPFDLDIFRGQPDVCVGDSASSTGGGSEVELGLGATAASLQASAGSGEGSSAVLLAQPASHRGGASDHARSDSSFSSVRRGSSESQGTASGKGATSDGTGGSELPSPAMEPPYLESQLTNAALLHRMEEMQRELGGLWGQVEEQYDTIG